MVECLKPSVVTGSDSQIQNFSLLQRMIHKPVFILFANLPVKCGKMDKPIEMPFGEHTYVDQRNNVLHTGAAWQIRLNDPCLVVCR